MARVRQRTRIIEEIDPEDYLFCHGCGMWKPAAAGFGTHRGQPSYGKRPYYQGRCKGCPGSRKVSKLKTAGHSVPSVAANERDPEVEAALGVLRDHRAQRRGQQGYVYAITDGEYIKLGYSVNPPKRVTELQTGNARLLSLLGTIKGTEQDERAMHAKYAGLNVLQEWFIPSSAMLAEFGIGVNPVAAKSGDQ